MPTIKVSAETRLSPKESFERVSRLFENDKELRKLDSELKCNFDPSSLSGTAQGKQFKAEMNVRPSAQGSSVELKVDLPFHLSLVKGMVQKTLEKKLSSALA